MPRVGLNLLKGRTGFDREGASGVSKRMRADVLGQVGSLSGRFYDSVDGVWRQTFIAVSGTERSPDRPAIESVVRLQIVEFLGDLSGHLDVLVGAALGVGQIEHPVVSERAKMLKVHRSSFRPTQNAVQQRQDERAVADRGGISRVAGSDKRTCLISRQERDGTIASGYSTDPAHDLAIRRIFLQDSEGNQPLEEATDGRNSTPHRSRPSAGILEIEQVLVDVQKADADDVVDRDVRPTEELREIVLVRASGLSPIVPVQVRGDQVCLGIDRDTDRGSALWKIRHDAACIYGRNAYKCNV